MTVKKGVKKAKLVERRMEHAQFKYDRPLSKYSDKGKVIPYKSNGGGRPTFDTENSFQSQFYKYTDSIRDNGYEEAPSFAGFAHYLGYTGSTVYRYLANHPDLKAKVKEAMADVLSEGAMMGKYRDASAIFTLKNRCGWTDKRESTNINGNKEVATEEEAKEAVMRFVEREKKA